MSRTILFCGGGSSGHLTPSLAVADRLVAADPGITPLFVCAPRSDEIQLLTSAKRKFVTIHAGKFPRGISFRLISFPILFLVACIESIAILHREKPVMIFSKGGYVSVPMCLVGRLFDVPIVLHSSDSVPNLSDSLVGRLADRVCTGFPITLFPEFIRKKAEQTGNPVRGIIGQGSKPAGQRITGFSGRRPIIMIIGGSQGSKVINEEIDRSFDALIELGDVIHLTGEGKQINRSHARYFARPFVTEELPHLYALADVVVTRAGAGVLAELAILQKPAIVIPLPGVAHDHQVHNAETLGRLGAVTVLRQEELSSLVSALRSLLADSDRRLSTSRTLSQVFPPKSGEQIAKIMLDVLRAQS
jgi:UDP-N-acetylglucosamine--N-acetylmuramyl-(pentapeptide) pyrophosphoryl-undecaprenol N-acetylglucosamine transferase